MSKGFKKEKPFEYLRRKNGERFSDETIRNWYVARAYVLDRLKDVAICQESGEHLQVVVNGDSPLMLSVARQVALSAHFANFDETCPMRSVITSHIGLRIRRTDIHMGITNDRCSIATTEDIVDDTNLALAMRKAG